MGRRQEEHGRSHPIREVFHQLDPRGLFVLPFYEYHMNTSNFKFTINLPTVTDLSPYYLVNLRCYLTPIPDISVSACVSGPKDIIHSPSNLAYK